MTTEASIRGLIIRAPTVTSLAVVTSLSSNSRDLVTLLRAVCLQDDDVVAFWQAKDARRNPQTESEGPQQDHQVNSRQNEPNRALTHAKGNSIAKRINWNHRKRKL